MGDGTPSPAIVGRHNPRLAWLRRVAHREEADLTVVDGTKLVVELARRGVEPEALFLTAESLAELDREPALARALRGPRAFVLDESTLARLAPTRTPQGVLAVVRTPRRRLPARGIVLYLDGVQDPGNVGSVVRCAAAFGATGVACSPGCADPFSPRAVRASAGHVLLLPVSAEAAFTPLAAEFLEAGGEVVGTGGDSALPLAAWAPRLPVLLAFGSEGRGLRPEVAEGCSLAVTIPRAGGVESLNVAVAAGVILAFAAEAAGRPAGLAG